MSVSQTQAGAWPEGATPVDGYLFEYLPQAALLLDRRLRVGMANRAASDLDRKSVV